MSRRHYFAMLTIALTFATAGRAQPYPSPGWSPPPAYGYYAPPPPSPIPSWILSAAGGKLQLQTSDGARATCDGLTISVSGAEAVEVLTEGQQIVVRSGVSSPGVAAQETLRGTSDRVSRSGPDGQVLTLEGNARLVVVRKGKRAELVSDRIAVNLATGRVEADLGGSTPPAAPYPAVTPCAPPPPPPLPPLSPATIRRGTEPLGAFAVWLGSFY
jgi:hypothetical protein